MKTFIATPDGRYLPGIPARDLTDEEVAALSDEDRIRIEQSGLYRDVPARPRKQEVTDASDH